MDGDDASIDSFDGRLRKEHLHAHGLTSQFHAHVIVETRQQEYKEARPKRSLDDLMPTACVQTLQQIPV